MSAAMPSPDDLRAAALWCEHHEGSEADNAPFLRVARWLEAQADAKELREMAREHGVPVSRLRKALG